MTTKSARAAISKCDLDALTAALDAGADSNAANARGYTLLMQAVYQNRLHMVDVLLSRGANVHQKDLYSQTALHFAASTWRSDVFRSIFSAAGPRAMNFSDCDGWTPLHCLARYGSAEHMAFALSHPGIDISVKNNRRETSMELSLIRRAMALETYGDQEARWQPLRYTWIKFLILPNTATMRVS
jgi:ankyrin repeat protein